LNDIPADWNRDYAPISLSVSDRPQFTSVAQGREAVAALQQRVLEMEGLRKALHESVQIEGRGLEELNRLFIWKLFERVEGLEASIGRLLETLRAFTTAQSQSTNQKGRKQNG
jgi:hypothetical protein